jgi:glycerophosphoryl diester phosphodiesterase
MQIIEQSIIPKNPTKKSEDGIVVTADYVAVIDGSTSKTDRRYSCYRSNGRYAMELIAAYLRRAPKNLSCHQFCIGATKQLRSRYSSIRARLHGGGLNRLAEHPEERLTASAIIFSRMRREIWMIGDCQCYIGDQYYDNPKPSEEILASQRAEIIKSSPQPWDHFRQHDTAREAIIPHMLVTMQFQNKTYSVIDGFPIPEQYVRIITLDFQPWEIVLASDGYPWLCKTLAESEERLRWQKENDPLNIGEFKATKAFMQGQDSFDDRAYIRFKV